MANNVTINDEPTIVIAAGNVVKVGADTTFHLGAKSSAPTLDNAGQALQASAKYFNTTNNIEYIYSGSVWLPMNELSGLVDANINSPAGNEVLKFNSSLGKWENSTIPADPAIASLEAAAGINLITSRKVLLDTWNVRQPLVNVAAYYNIAWIPEISLFVTIEEAIFKDVVTSPDGINWTIQSTPTPNDSSKKIYYSNILNKAVIFNSNQVLESDDGITWVARALTIYGIQDIAESATTIVAVQEGGSDEASYSTDGYNWTGVQAPYTAGSITNAAYSPTLNRFVMLHNNGAVNYSDNDGVTWIYGGDAGVGTNWRKIKWIPTLNIFVAIDLSKTTTSIAVSPNGISWTSIAVDDYVSWKNVAWAEELGVLMAVGQINGGESSYPVLMQSYDGYNWTPKTVVAALNHYNTSITWSSSLGVFVCSASTWGNLSAPKFLMSQ
jgi:hypothetical protein